VLPADAPLRSILPLFASGIHRIAITSLDSAPLILTDAMLLEHLISLPPDLIPTNFNLAVTSSTLNLPLHPLISLPGTASVLDAMQVMSAQGLSALGVLSGSGSGSNRSSSSSSGSTSGSGVSSKSPSEGHFSSSPLLMPTLSPGLDVTAPPLDNPTGSGELISVVTAQDCTTLVVPSEGKQVLGMGLQHMVKALQVIEHAGETRGEERMPGALPRYQLSSLIVPVHTVTFSTILLHACHLILATASSRVFMRTPLGVSPPLSPTPSLTMSAFSPPSSPSLSSLSLSDTKPISHHISPPGLPLPPPIQLSPHYVISILDILACLAKAYHTKLAPPSPQVDDSVIIFPSSDESPLLTTQTWDLDPAGMGKRRRASAAAAEHAAIESWRWIGDVSH